MCTRLPLSRIAIRARVYSTTVAARSPVLNMTKPKLIYFPLRGRGEVIRMILTVAGQDFDEAMPNYEDMKVNTDTYPFGQCPRYLAKKHHMNGTSVAEEVAIDMIMEGVESLRQKYGTLIYQDELAPAAKEKWWAVHGDKTSSSSRNGGAHLMYLAHFLDKNHGGAAFVVGDRISVADLVLYDITELLVRIFPEEMKREYPSLMGLFTRLSEIPTLKEYFATKRPAKINGNPLG